jgi:acetyl-CoA synthetase
MRYVTEEFDEHGNLTKFRATAPDDFNYAHDIIDDIAENDPERMAMYWCNPEGEEHEFTFADFSRMSNQAANFLVEQGIERGHKVIVILRRHYSFWVTCLALHKIGAIPIPATFMLKEHDLDYRIKASGAKALVVTTVGDIASVTDHVMAKAGQPGYEYLDGVQLFLANCAQFDLPGGEGTVADTALMGARLSGPDGVFAATCERRGWTDFNAGVRAASRDWERRPNKASDPMLMYFTSGTSGEPKIVVHDYTYPLGHLTTAKYWHAVEADAGPHFTIADSGWAKTAWGKFYGQWAMEAAQVVYDFDRFNADEILALVPKYKMSTFCCPPTMYRMLSLADVDAYDLSSVDRFTTAGEALNPDLFDFWLQHTGKKIYEGFGQTEGPVIVGNLVGSDPKPGSMGKPVPFANIEIHRPDETRCDPGEPGEICIECNPRPTGLVVEYYQCPEKTADVFRNGWYHTGDVAWMDEDGYYFYEGRNDDVIKSSGYRIGPFEIESVLLQHEAVRECAVTGVPDPLRGKAVKATVVLAPGFQGTDALTKELQTWVKTQTAPYKYPRIIEYVDVLPKTFSGKIRRVEIRETDAANGVEHVG